MSGKSVFSIIQIMFGLALLADYLFKGIISVKLFRLSPHRVNRVLVLWGGIILTVIGLRSFFPGLFTL